jgi:nucleolar protein 9
MPRPFKRKRSKFDDTREERRKARATQATENVKRRKLENQGPANLDEAEDDFIPLEGHELHDSGENEPVFYGLLDADEQAYYTNVNNKIAANDFEDDEDRRNFIQAVYRESQGKELKLASSQSCSRHLERIILVSSPEQLQTLFEKLLEGLAHLAQHRFGSHVLETLFLEAAKHVKKQDVNQDQQDGISSRLEKQFLQVAKELEPNLGHMLTDRYASHVLRVLLLIFAGEPLHDPNSKKILASKKKEKLDPPTKEEPSAEARPVPKTFKAALSDLTTQAVSTLDDTYLRALATHPTGNPILQLLLKLELTNSDKGRALGNGSLFYKLLSPDSLEADSEGAKFVSGLTYDSTGSHLMETIVQYAPGKTFKKIYRGVWKPKLASMAKNDVASYVVIRILERLGKDDLAEARDLLLPELPTLLQRRRLTVIKALVDRCVVRETELQPVAEALNAECGRDKSSLLQTLLQTEHSDAENAGTGAAADSATPPRADVHGSLLAQTLLQAPQVSTLIQESLLATEPDSLVYMAKDSSASRVLQTAITSSAASAGFRKQMVPKFYNHMVDLAMHPSGSYMVESLWDGTNGIHFMKERLASELAKHESELRDSLYGRSVWRSWLMDLYIRRRGEWQARAKGLDGNSASSEGQKKSGIQLARERYAQQRLKGTQSGIRPERRLTTDG